jgi:hypothetical protein
VLSHRIPSAQLAFGYMAAMASLPLAIPAADAEALGSASISPVQLVSKVSEAEARRDSNVRGIVSSRRYVLQNQRWEKPAVMEVRMTYKAGVGKTFEILSMENTGGLQKRALERILESEVEASKASLEIREGAIAAGNYDFTPLGSQNLNGRECLVLELKPKRSSKYLLDGKAWIDPKEHAIVRVEGRTARSVSFWIGKPFIVLDFRKVDDIWVSSANHSVSDVKFLGKTELSVEFTGYKILRGDRELARTHPPADGY